MGYRAIISTVLLFSFGALLVLWPEIDEICRNCRTTELLVSHKNFIKISKSANLYRSLDYDLQAIKRNDRFVPRTYLYSMPDDFKSIDNIEQRKVLFIQIVLPQILRINEQLIESRNKLLVIKRQIQKHKKLTSYHSNWLEEIAEQYECDKNDIDKLLTRVDIIPPSVALAQAIVESGWGTSRFTIEGRALFGQRTFGRNKYGLIPKEADNPDFRVVRFRRLIDSVWGYALTLNTHPAHAQFRQERLMIGNNNRETKSYLLANALKRYSERGTAYTDLLIQIILRNDLASFDNAKLAPPNS